MSWQYLQIPSAVGLVNPHSSGVAGGPGTGSALRFWMSLPRRPKIAASSGDFVLNTKTVFGGADSSEAMVGNLAAEEELTIVADVKYRGVRLGGVVT